MSSGSVTAWFEQLCAGRGTHPMPNGAFHYVVNTRRIWDKEVQR
jgi:hypothetical protein